MWCKKNIMEDNYLQENLKSIEENNEKHFGDPFFDLHYLMQDFYRTYFSEESMSDYTVEIGILVQHLDSLMASLDDISHGLLRQRLITTSEGLIPLKGYCIRLYQRRQT